MGPKKTGDFLMTYKEMAEEFVKYLKRRVDVLEKNQNRLIFVIISVSIGEYGFLKWGGL